MECSGNCNSCINGFKSADLEMKESFNNLRKHCPVLNAVLPDKQWNDLNDYINIGCDKANHMSIYLWGYECNILYRITKCLYEFSKHKKFTDQYTKQYTQDLIETWLTKTQANGEVKSIEVHRHKKSREYLGKIYELIFAYALKEKGFEIINLEAWDKNYSDIEAAFNGVKYLIECKYIGLDDDIFKSDISKEVFSFSPRINCEYIMFRACEASESICRKENSTHIKIASIILGDGPALYWKSLDDGILSSPNLVFDNCLKKKLKKMKGGNAKKRLRENILENPNSYLNNIDNIIVYCSNAYGLKYLKSRKQCPEFEINKQEL